MGTCETPKCEPAAVAHRGLTLVPVRLRGQVVAWVILSPGGQLLLAEPSLETAMQAAEFLSVHR